MDSPPYLLVDYELSKYSIVTSSRTVDFISGYLFPYNGDIVLATFDYGDGTVETVEGGALKVDQTSELISKVPNFFPNWRNSESENAGCCVPKFKASHTYLKDGIYVINTTLVSEAGVQYIGLSYEIEVIASNYVNLYDNFVDIDSQYSYTSDEDIIGYDNEFYPPYVRVNPLTNLTSLPLSFSVNLFGVTGRVIDYVLWDMGDGTKLFKAGAQPFNYDFYKLPKADNIITTIATVYFTGDDGIKYKFNVTDYNILNFIAAIGKSDEFTESDNLRSFTMYPAYSYSLPVITSFYHEVTPNLKYIISNYDDGSYDITPVNYNYALPNEIQIQAIEHEYTFVANYRFQPRCIYVYENTDDGSIYYNYAALKTNLFYDLAVINNEANFLLEPIDSSTNYRKYNNLSTLVIYPSLSTDTGSAYLTTSLHVGITENNILTFDKIIWSIGETEIVQDKNTSFNFGTISFEIITSITDLQIRAELYYGSSVGLSFYGQYTTGGFDILGVDDSIQFNVDQSQTFTPVLNITYNSILPTAITYTGLLPTGQPLSKEIEEAEYNLVFESGDLFFLEKVVIFDKLFEAINPAANFLNRNNPTTATTFSNDLITKQSMGFFRASKTSLIVVDPGIFIFHINSDNLDFFTPTYLPNPYIYGSETAGIDFKVNNNYFKRGLNLGSASSEPITNNACVTYNGYNANNISIDTSAESINQSVYDLKRDIYGNTFILLDTNYYFRSNVSVGNTQLPTNHLTAYSINTSNDPVKLTTYSSQLTATNNIVLRNNELKTLYVSNTNKTLMTFASAFAYGASKYSTSVWRELSSNLIRRCDIVYNTIFIETPSYFVIDRIESENNIFIDSGTPNLWFEHTSAPFNKISNRYKKDNFVYFAILSAVGVNSASDTRDFTVFPLIYKFDSNTFSISQIYPLESNTLESISESFSFNTAGVQYIEACTPRITYFSKTNTFNLSYLLKDLNKSPYLVSVNFEVNDVVTLKEINGVKITADNSTVMFTSSAAFNTLTWLLTSATPTVNSAGYLQL